MDTKKLLNYLWKIAILIIVSLVCLGRMVTNGLDTYQDTRESEYYNFGLGENDNKFLLMGGIEQIITMKGDELTEIALFLTEVDTNSNDYVQIRIKDGNEKVYGSEVFALADCLNGDWNKFPMKVEGLRNNANYIIEISSEDEKVCALLKDGEFDTTYFGSVRIGDESYPNALNCGLKYKYNYMTYGSIFQIAADYTIVIMLLGLLAYSLYHFEKLKENLETAGKSRGLILAVCSSVQLFFTINPISKNVTELKEFSRNIGVGIINLYDVTRVIRNFNLCFIVLAVSFLFFYLLFNDIETRMFKNSSETEEFWSSLNMLFLVNMCLRGIVFYQNTDKKYFHYSGYIFVLVYLCVFVYNRTKLKNRVNSETILQYCLTAMTLAVPLAACMTSEWRDGRFLLGIQCLLLMLTFVYLMYAPKLVSIDIFSLFSVWMPLLLSIYAEFVIVLNQRGIFITQPKTGFICLTLGYIIIALVVSVILTKKQKRVKNFKAVAYPGIIIGMTSMAVQPLLTNSYTVDFIESSNASILISDFLNFKSVPIVEHYGGHMMSSVWEGIVYGLITGDKAGAIYSPYSGYFTVVIALLFYWFVKTVLSEDAALITVLFIPFYEMSGYFGLGLSIAIALIAYNRKQSLKNGFLIWLFFVWTTLYRLDMGFSFLWGIGIVLAAGAFSTKQIKYLKNALISLAVTGITGIVAWALLCVRANVDPVNRLKEFLLLSASNQTWAYEGMGDVNLTAFSVMYLFLPMLIIVVMMYMFITKKYKAGIKEEIWLLLFFLGGAYFGNFSRTIVRHSVYEMKIHILIWTAFMFAALFVASYVDKKLLIPVYMLLYILVCNFKSDTVYVEQPVANRATANITSLVDCWSLGRFNKDNPDSMTIWEQSAAENASINRVAIDEEIGNRIDGYEYLIDSLLESSQSFVECMDRTFLYSALGRKSPLYVSQSPIQISGEFTQEQYVMQMEAAKDTCPILLLPVDGQNFRASSYLEGASHTYKYYKVFEYIYDNYSPLCAYSDVAVWCRNDQLDKMRERAGHIEGAVLIDWGYDGPVADEAGVTQWQNFLHNYTIGGLANAWANLDVKNAAGNQVIAEGVRRANQFDFDISSDAYAKPAYLGISLKGMGENGTVTVVLGENNNGTFTEKCQYTLDINEKSDYYMIRISSDYYWHLGCINSMYVYGSEKIYINDAKIITGD